MTNPNKMTKPSRAHHPPPPRQQQHHPPPPRQQQHHPQLPRQQPHHPPPPQLPQYHPPQPRQPQHPPPPPQHPQYHPPPSHYQHPLPPHRPSKPSKPRRTKLASCIVATVFLVFIIIIIFILYFTLLKPKDPKITVTGIQIPTFTVSSNTTTVSFTFSQYAAVHNPNHAVFSHFDSTLQLLYAGNQVAFMFIPAGNISAGRTDYMTATFSVQSFPIMTATEEGNVPAMVLPPVTDGIDRVQPTMELESRTEMVGRVRVMWFFTHHVETVADCRVTLSINDGSVLGFHC